MNKIINYRNLRRFFHPDLTIFHTKQNNFSQSNFYNFISYSSLSQSFSSRTWISSIASSMVNCSTVSGGWKALPGISPVAESA